VPSPAVGFGQCLYKPRSGSFSYLHRLELASHAKTKRRPLHGWTSVAYRDSYPDTIMTCVKSVPLLPCWTWTVFLIFYVLEWKACLSDPAKSLVVEPDRNFSKILVFRRVFGAVFSSIIA
jgi:hypothetical protein